MFVKTQFDTIVNLSEFGRVKLQLNVKQDSGDILHIISAVSEEYSYKPKIGVSIDIADDAPTRTVKVVRLAEFPENSKELAEGKYNGLFSALSQGKTVFDISESLLRQPEREPFSLKNIDS